MPKLAKADGLPAVYREWLDELPFEDSTKGNYQRGFRRIVGWADIEPAEFTPASLDLKTTEMVLSKMRREVDKGKLKQEALDHALRALRSFFAHCKTSKELGDLELPDLEWLRTEKLADAAAMPPIYDEWLASLPGQEDHNTTVNYGQGLRRLVYFAKIPPAEFTHASLDPRTTEKALLAIRVEGLSESVQHQCRTAWISFLAYCRANGLEVPDIDGHYLNLPEEDKMPKIYHEWTDSLTLLEDKPETTRLAYGQGLRRLVYFAKIPPAEFTPDSLDQLTVLEAVTEMRRHSVSKPALNLSLAALASFADYCEAKRLVAEAPDSRRIRKLTKLDAEQVDPKYYRPADLRDLFTTAAASPDRHGVRWPVRDLAMCSFLAVLGLRASELSNADLNWMHKERLIEVKDGATWMLHVRGKGRKIRRLPLSDELVEANGRWQEAREERFGVPPSDAPLFVTYEGRRFNYQRLRYWLRRLNQESALRDRSLHALRHTAGVRLAADGVPMNVIQSLLGHASISTTGIYTELVGDELVGVLNRSEINGLLRDVLKQAK
jgi:site-specific recombinase XerD|tara:strand:- start:45 stop:1694 length:1650 start_codon:yes stop_codon:yes gene_type:complete